MTMTLLMMLLAGTALPADFALSANDGKQQLVEGRQIVPPDPAPDSLSVIDLSGPRIVASVAVPASVIGPPRSVAIAPDRSFALVTSARRVEHGALVPDDLVSLVDLRGPKPVVSATLHAGAGAAGVAISPDGRTALVANRTEGTLSIFAIAGQALSPAGTIAIGPGTSPAQPLFYDGGRHVLLTRDGDHRISVLAMVDGKMTPLSLTLAPGLRPYAIDTAGPRTHAVVGNIGGGGHDIDTIALILLDGATPRVVDSVAVGLTPEGLKMSPDGRFVAITVNDGSNAAPGSPRYHKDGILQVWEIAGDRLRLVTQAPMGRWGQGVAWSRDGRTILAQAMDQRRIDVFAFDGKTLRHKPAIAMPAGPAAMATEDR
ncbi:beta-propeller fold lactonase family protein [Sphingobium aquiterrae]|uniref:beta-propeller fold lactonase family protein n=1 Tax=Sphingobium aquiterrae TaxID=2038656 RepID=UPI003016F9E2